ncbi:MAG TPA: ParA family protein [Rhodanobacteraceae bacterium]|nr:ParA family protein [Rhodanobacteraceae bacterium]
MRKVLVASGKGGCGKTTLATNLAAYWSGRKRNTVAIDADPQGSTLRWCEKRPDTVPGVLGLTGKRHALERLPPDSHRVVIDSAAGSSVDSLGYWLDAVDAVVVPILPSTIDLEASLPWLDALAAHPRVKRGKLPVALVANRLKPWTNASQLATAEMREFPFSLEAELRDSQAYVLLAGLGKGLFDYHSEHVRSHQQDWARLLRWLRRCGES